LTLFYLLSRNIFDNNFTATPSATTIASSATSSAKTNSNADSGKARQIDVGSHLASTKTSSAGFISRGVLGTHSAVAGGVTSLARSTIRVYFSA
jgi:hypothetical protein